MNFISSENVLCDNHTITDFSKGVLKDLNFLKPKKNNSTKIPDRDIMNILPNTVIPKNYLFIGVESMISLDISAEVTESCDSNVIAFLTSKQQADVTMSPEKILSSLLSPISKSGSTLTDGPANPDPG